MYLFVLVRSAEQVSIVSRAEKTPHVAIVSPNLSLNLPLSQRLQHLDKSWVRIDARPRHSRDAQRFFEAETVPLH